MTSNNLYWLDAPYDVFRSAADLSHYPVAKPGTALVWVLTADTFDSSDITLIDDRPRGISLAIVLPPPDEIHAVARHLNQIAALEPNAVLPAGDLATPQFIRHALAGGPKCLPKAVSRYLARHRIVTSSLALSEIVRIFELAPRTSTINKLCRDLFLSRRTLGRHFEACGIPVPSHWLQFARLLHVVLRAQSERLAMFKIALSAGYPDGFTLSNQLKRMIGYRPREVRQLIGFEWLLERWLHLEKERRNNRSVE
jgi:AraC-like DNA-binding protein